MSKWMLWLLGSALLTQAPSPYAGEEKREIKALSQEEAHGLARGDGMGMARAAELNGFPGPKHVLELAEALELTADQRRDVGEVFDRMKARAVELGEAVIERERELDAGFAGRTLDAEQLRRATLEVASRRGELRYVHLIAHLETTALLEPRQVESYARLRGYGSGAHDTHRHHEARPGDDDAGEG